MRFFLFLFLLINIGSQAQSDSIPVIEVSGAKAVRLPIQPQQLSLDSAVLVGHSHQSLADVLNKHSHLFIKNYGAGGLATVSNRGGSAAQTSLLWEGIPIQNNMLGQSDLSLVPAFWVDRVDLEAAGGNTQGSIGGAIILAQKPNFGAGWRYAFGTQTGNLGEFQQQLKLQYSNKMLSLGLRSFYHNAQNNFRFRHPNLIGKPWVRQQNAQLEQAGILSEIYVQPTENHLISAKTWYQYSLRYIPPSLLQNTADDRQVDQYLRQTLAWHYRQPNFSLKLRAAAVWDLLNYQNAAVNSQSQSLCYWLQNELDWRFGKPHQFKLNSQYSLQKARSSGYDAAVQQHRLALAATYNLSFIRWALSLNIREELVDNKFIIPSFSGVFEYRIGTFWKTNLSFSHNYRLPTFNDLYWEASGNPNLRPEYSWNLNWNYTIDFKINKHFFNFNFSAYSQWVRDWILWVPDGLSGLWRPENVLRVWARGIESNGSWKTDLAKNWTLGLRYRYALHFTTDGEGRQLIYAPLHNAALGLDIGFRQWAFSYQHQLVSRRYISSDNLEWLPLYQFGDVEVTYKNIFKKLHFSCFFRCQNAVGQPYQVISQRLVAARQWVLGLRYE